MIKNAKNIPPKSVFGNMVDEFSGALVNITDTQRLIAVNAFVSGLASMMMLSLKALNAQSGQRIIRQLIHQTHAGYQAFQRAQNAAIKAQETKAGIVPAESSEHDMSQADNKRKLDEAERAAKRKKEHDDAKHRDDDHVNPVGTVIDSGSNDSGSGGCDSGSSSDGGGCGGGGE